MKNLVEGERDYTSVKEVLGWILDMEAGTVTLPERNIEEFLTLVEIPATQRRMGRKYLERLVEKLRSMYLAVPGAVGGLFHIQRALNQGGVDQAWISLAFHLKLADWKALVLQAAPRTTHLAEIVSGLPLQACGWEGACPSSGVQADAPGRNRPLGTHPSRVL